MNAEVMPEKNQKPPQMGKQVTLLICSRSLKRNKISYFSVALGSTLEQMVTFQGGHIQTVYLYVGVYINIHIF